MFSASRMRLSIVVLLLSAALAAGCNRWHVPRAYEVSSQGDPQGSYAAVLEVVNAEHYKILSQDSANRRVRLEAHASGAAQDRKSFIDVEVAAPHIKLTGSGYLTRNGKFHKSLSNELAALEAKLKERFGTGADAGSAAPTASVVASAPPPASSGVPDSWSEPAYDPAVWGNGNFTCLPVRVPPEHQSVLTLKLSNGEKADLQLSLAYAPELCRSPSACKVPGGCPALGIGDTERVNKLAARLKKGEITPKATLFDGQTAVAGIDLAKHGSIVQAMSEIKK